MDIDPEDIIKKQIDGKGIHVSYSIDIRVVERFFKKLFGKKEELDESDSNGPDEETK